MATATLLVEIRSEELPPALVCDLAARFPRALLDALKKRGFAGDAALPKSDALATPRRVAALLPDIHSHTAEKAFFRRGPQINACYDADGAPTKALIGFMHGVGVTCEKDLSRVSEKGRDYIAYQGKQPPQVLAEQLAGIVEAVLWALPAPRLMRWGDNDFKFIRPIRGVLMMLGDTVISHGAVMGVGMTPHTVGHPVLANKEIVISSADEYEMTLENEGKVIVNREKRKEKIEKDIKTNPRKYTEINIHSGYLLIEQNADMCEYPNVCEGEFNNQFVEDLPAFCLVECLMKHQYAFPVFVEHKTLTNRFQFVIDHAPPNNQNIIKGFNNVVRARLQDMLFYFNEDKKIEQKDAYAKLDKIVYHRKLGSQQQRAQRLQNIGGEIANRMGLSVEDRELLKQAAKLFLCDLPTLMVQEYPMLQGKMAAEYADNETDTNDKLRGLLYTSTLDTESVAEESSTAPDYALNFNAPLLLYTFTLSFYLEKLVGMFGIGEKPSGSKDPHGLRRAAKIIAYTQGRCETNKEAKRNFEGKRHALPIDELIQLAHAEFTEKLPAFNTKEIRDFIIERERSALSQFGTPANILNAVLATDHEYLIDIFYKARALEELPEAPALIEINKRVNNILRKSDAKDAMFNKKLLTEEAEKNLDNALRDYEKKFPHNYLAVNKNGYADMLQNLADIKPAVDDFFDKVMVNADDDNIRANRHALLRRLQEALTKVGDLSLLGDVSS